MKILEGKIMKFLIVLMFFLIASCSNLSKNMVSEGDFSIRSGMIGNFKWDTSLEFKRISWHHELNLLYDVMYVNIDETNKFYNWFSSDEKRRIFECNKKLLVISYALDSERISHPMFKNILKDHGYESYSTPNFARALKTHPDYERNALSLYKVDLFCHKTTVSDDIYIGFPNFREVKL